MADDASLNQIDNSKYHVVLLFGPPGVGKGTQGRLLGQIPGFVHVASGDIFRSMDKNSEIGRTFLEYSSKGELVPDEITIEMWHEFVESKIASGSYDPSSEMMVLDGIPRNTNQARIMDQYIKVHAVANLTIHCEDVLLRRMQGRAEKEGRHDDSQENVIRNRFEVYRKQTLAMLNHYDDHHGIIHDIDADGTPCRVLLNILEAVVPVQDATFGNIMNVPMKA